MTCLAPIRRPGAARRIVLYSHDTLGFGHLRRNLLLAGALRKLDPAPDILLIAGMQEAGAFNLPEGMDILTLPAYGKRADGSYHARSLTLDLRELATLRAEIIRGAVLAFEPDLMVVDNVPRGAQSELDRALSALKKRGTTRIVLGLRDVIDEAPAVRSQWLARRNFAAVRNWFDEVWVYGDRAFFDLVKEYDFGEDFAARTHYLGYLDQRNRLAAGSLPAPDPADPYVLCAVGGGRDGAALCHAFARAELPAGHRGILITGTQMAASDRAQLMAAARPNLQVVEFLPEPLPLMAGAARIVAMGGYNTVSEALSLARPTLIIPRVRPRQEQILRAERLAAMGAIDMLHPAQLSPAKLTEWMAAPLAPPPPLALDIGGLDRLRERASALIGLGIVERAIA